MVRSVFYHSVDMEIHYQTEGAGMPLICLHGGKGNSGDYFFPYLSPLAETYQMIYLDERGSGKSKPVPDVSLFSYAGFEADISNLIASLGAESVALLGHSFGGKLAMYYAMRHSEQVCELYCVAGGPVSEEYNEHVWQPMYEAELKRSGVGDQVRAIQDSYNQGRITGDDSYRRVSLAQAPLCFYHWSQRRAEIIETLNRTDYTFLGEGKSNFDDEPQITRWLLSHLKDIRCPTLQVAGQHDISMLVESFGPLARGIPDCRMCVIPNSGHYPFVEEPERILAALAAFRQELSSR